MHQVNSRLVKKIPFHSYNDPMKYVLFAIPFLLMNKSMYKKNK